jgi:hypothetical protein
MLFVFLFSFKLEKDYKLDISSLVYIHFVFLLSSKLEKDYKLDNMQFVLFFSSKLEKDYKKKWNEAGLYRTELTGSEVSEEMEKERKIFQLQLCSVSL